MHGIILLGLLSLSIKGQDYTNYKTPDGHDFAVRITLEKETIMFGETTFILFEVTNRSDKELSFGDGGDYRNNLGRPESYTVSVVHDDGTPVPQPEVGLNMGGLIGVQSVPVNGSYVRKLFLPHWATFETTGTYKVTVARGLSIRASSDRATDVVKTSAKAKIKIVDTDGAELDSVIHALGTKMLDGRSEDDSRHALMLLNFIKDDRAIQYWLKALDIYSKTSEWQTLSLLRRTPVILAKYDTAESFAALEAAMKSKNNEVRLDVADAFGISVNPRALSLLLSMENDLYYFVRLRVVQAWGRLKTDESTKKLIEKLTDNDGNVRKQAEEYLRSRDKLPDPMPLLPIANQGCPIRQTSVFKSMQDGSSGASSTSGNTGIFSTQNCGKALEAFFGELSSSRAAKNMLSEAWILYQIGDIYSETKRYKEALEYYEIALPLFRLLKDDGLHSLLYELGNVSQALKDYPRSVDYLHQNLVLARSSENKYIRSNEGNILERIAHTYLASGDVKKGAEYLDKWLSFERKEENEAGQRRAYTALGRFYEKKGQKAESLECYQKALNLAAMPKSKWFRDFLEDEIKELREAIARLTK